MKYCDRDVFPWIWFIVLSSNSPKTACKSLRATYVRTVTKFHVLETPPWSSEFGKCQNCHSWEPAVTQPRNLPNFMVPKDMLSFPQVTAKPDFYIMFRYMICVVTAILVDPPLLHTRQRSTAYRPSATATSTYPVFAAAVKISRLCCHVSCIARSCPHVINLYLFGWKASFKTPVNICWCHQGGITVSLCYLFTDI